MPAPPNSSRPIPSPRGPRGVPLLGSSGALIRFFADPVKQMLTNQRLYGDVSALADKDPSLMFAFGARYNKVVLSDQRRFENWADLPLPAPAGSAPTLLNKALTAENGDVHRLHRRMMMPAFSRQNVSDHRNRMADIVERRTLGLTPGRTVDVPQEMTEIALGVAMECLFGVDVSDDVDSLGRLALRFLRGMTSPMALMLPLSIPGLPYARFRKDAEGLVGKLRVIIAERRRSGGRRSDLLSMLISARDDDGAVFTEEELIGQALVMFVAGHETTAQTLTWTLFLLSQHPQIMRALGDELHERLGGAAPTVAQLGELALLDRVVKESMRLLPATPFLFLRRATEPFELGGVELPPGARVILSPLMTHRDATLFPEPKRFVPDRWKSVEPTPYEYLPFGAGPRTCIGAPFAGQAIRIALATMLQRAHFELAPDARVSRRVQGITLGPKYAMPMRLVAPGAPVATQLRPRGDIGDLVDLG